MNVIGIDPGKSGAIAVLDETGALVELTVMPVVAAGKKGKAEYDADSLVRLLEQHRPTLVVLEKLQTLPRSMGGGSANFQRGFARALVEGIAAALRIPRRLVAPRVWQATMLAGTPDSDTKQRSIIAAQRLFPGVRLTRTARATKLDDGLSDALLLAEFGRRERGGQQGAAA